MAPSIVAIREEMIDVYLWHNTRKVADVDALLREWAGEESLLLAKVRAKYAVVDHTRGSASARHSTCGRRTHEATRV